MPPRRPAAPAPSTPCCSCPPARPRTAPPRRGRRPSTVSRWPQWRCRILRRSAGVGYRAAVRRAVVHLRDAGTAGDARHRPEQLFFITGADAFADIASWHDYPAVLDRSHFVVVARPGHPLAGLRARLTHLERADARGGRPRAGARRIRLDLAGRRRHPRRLLVGAAAAHRRGAARSTDSCPTPWRGISRGTTCTPPNPGELFACVTT